MSGYRDTIEAVGYTVLEFQEFGDYQGTWIGLVVKDGEIGFISDSYGSCGGCDAFEGEVGYDASTEELKDFGQRYVDAMQNYDTIYNRFKKDLDWDLEASAIITWLEDVKKNSKYWEFKKDIKEILDK
jgi:glycosyltransferase involved in cell wall biosynthesis